VCHLGNLFRLLCNLAEVDIMISRALKGFDDILRPKHTSTLLSVYCLGMLYTDQGKLAEAEAMFDRALQGYKDTLSVDLASSYLLALNTMFAFSDLFS
jgi:tetratricopeptide (TPR) repeat protein